MRLALLLAVLAACRKMESYDDCMAIELRQNACSSHGKPPSPASLSFIRDSCDDGGFRAVRVDEPPCLQFTDCDRFTSCIQSYNSAHGLGSPFGVAH